MESAAALDDRLPEPASGADVVAVVRGERSARPRILLAATLRWPLAARLAIAFRALDCPVEAWCPAGHPLEKTLAVGRIHPGGALAPGRTLHAAIRASAPDLVIPCDDDAALHLVRLHQRSAARESRNKRVPVMPAKAGIQGSQEPLDSRFRGNDVKKTSRE